jgi:CubicO group peptidase (beta-lactamase class C family)
MNLNFLLYILIFTTSFSCKKTVDTSKNEAMYFPSTTITGWETKLPTEVGFNTNALQPLKDFLVSKNTKSFMILVNGRIVMEEYFNGHTATDTWEWNSAGKTLTSAIIGIAQNEGFLNINTRVNQYLGAGWTSAPLAKEILITPRHLLTMTSGLNDASDIIIKQNLTYVADAGTRWSYNNVFQKLMDIVSNSTNHDFETYFNTKIKAKIGMEGFWNMGLIYKIYHSNTRSMARYGLLALNKGKWNGEQVIPEAFFTESTSSSQTINPSYGYLWWLNGKPNYMVPGSQIVFQESLIPNAPNDMFAALGAKDQRIYVIPTKNMVIIRMGNAAEPNNPSFAVSGFDNALWEKIRAVIN